MEELEENKAKKEQDSTVRGLRKRRVPADAIKNQETSTRTCTAV